MLDHKTLLCQFQKVILEEYMLMTCKIICNEMKHLASDLTQYSNNKAVNIMQSLILDNQFFSYVSTVNHECCKSKFNFTFSKCLYVTNA